MILNKFALTLPGNNLSLNIFFDIFDDLDLDGEPPIKKIINYL
jgi:hypothetical protein